MNTTKNKKKKTNKTPCKFLLPKNKSKSKLKSKSKTLSASPLRRKKKAQNCSKVTQNVEPNAVLLRHLCRFIDMWWQRAKTYERNGIPELANLCSEFTRTLEFLHILEVPNRRSIAGETEVGREEGDTKNEGDSTNASAETQSSLSSPTSLLPPPSSSPEPPAPVLGTDERFHTPEGGELVASNLEELCPFCSVKMKCCPCGWKHWDDVQDLIYNNSWSKD